MPTPKLHQCLMRVKICNYLLSISLHNSDLQPRNIKSKAKITMKCIANLILTQCNKYLIIFFRIFSNVQLKQTTWKSWRFTVEQFTVRTKCNKTTSLLCLYLSFLLSVLVFLNQKQKHFVCLNRISALSGATKFDIIEFKCKVHGRPLM